MSSPNNTDDDWCTIESDPGVFTELLEELGCQHIQLEEVLSLDDESLLALQESGQVYGFIFLFQWQSPDENPLKQQQQSFQQQQQPPLTEDQIPQDLFFAHQVTTNACATQAILSVLFNIPPHPNSVELGPILSEFQEFTSSFPPSLKGVSIGSSEPIKRAHNAFGRTDAFLNDGKYVNKHSSRGKSEEVYHFIAYIPKNGIVYELDGLKSGPVIVGEYDDNNNSEQGDAATATATAIPWMAVARNAIQQRMAGDAIQFNLMAVIQDKRIGLKQKLQQATDANIISTLSYQLQVEETLRAQWKLENQRRRHNYVPLCVSILQELARAGTLPKLVEEAKARKRQKMAAAGAVAKK